MTMIKRTVLKSTVRTVAYQLSSTINLQTLRQIVAETENLPDGATVRLDKYDPDLRDPRESSYMTITIEVHGE